ncbi:Rv2175c family DNA-binding protein [Leucobacter sp. 1207-22]|uniref:Rv2175c family DNA-binding protein n=1 Tax=Leucobacter sp. 1207-22 TaxID=2604456 RepID=UPI004062813B
MSEQRYLAIPDLVEIFGVTPGRVRRMIEERYLLAVRVDGVLSVPEEFVLDGEPVAGVRGTALVLLDAGFSETEAVEWMLAENEELGARPIDELRLGRKAGVRRATQGLAF